MRLIIVPTNRNHVSKSNRIRSPSRAENLKSSNNPRKMPLQPILKRPILLPPTMRLESVRDMNFTISRRRQDITSLLVPVDGEES